MSKMQLKEIGDARWNEILEWKTATDLAQLATLVKDPPLRSVVVKVHPAAAKAILETTNDFNRPLSGSHGRRLQKSLEKELNAITGDTVKFSLTGRMLDGQHRMNCAANAELVFTTHMVFGLPDHIFDILDQGKRRTAADILATRGFSNQALLSAAISWVLRFQGGSSEGSMISTGGLDLTPRDINRMIDSEMKGIEAYVAPAKLIQQSYGHPASLLVALLFYIGRHNKNLAREFAHEWVNGPKSGRNAAFGIFKQRVDTTRRTTGHAVPRMAMAAMMVQTFNCWQSGEAPGPMAILWKPGQPWPRLIFTRSDYLKHQQAGEQAQQAAERRDTSLTANQLRLLTVLGAHVDGDQSVEMSHARMCELANIPNGSIHYILYTLEDAKLIKKIRGRVGVTPACYKVTPDNGRVGRK